MRVAPDAWSPVDVAELEPAADQVVRSVSNGLVTAGPGAGKTELLAQRGCFLLQTGLCPPPRKILAVSFKVDAAANLAARVEKRCGQDARRFHSVTLDAFCKGLVDRFRQGLPAAYRPVAGFSPRLVTPRDAELGEFLQSLDPPPHLGGQAALRGISRERFYRREILGTAIVWPCETPSSLDEWCAREYWHQMISVSHADGGTLSFPMIARLADLVLRVNPRIVEAIRAAYPFVFLDEFQDTTAWHYETLRTAFLQSESCITAVGDTKQRIMLWAGAMSNVMEAFEDHFEADETVLVRNYRSAPGLVAMQNQLVEMLDGEPGASISVGTHQGQGACLVLDCEDVDTESQWIADRIVEGIDQGHTADDFCLIYRQRVAHMAQPAIQALQNRGVRARDETPYQDLSGEVVVHIMTASIDAAVRRPAPDAWMFLCAMIRHIHGLSEDDPMTQRLAADVVNTAREALEQDVRTPDEIVTVGAAILDSVGRTAIEASVPAYSQKGRLDLLISRAAELLAFDHTQSSGWAETINRFSGKNTVKAMTIHKSKGLEYDTVVFVGLEDSSWWTFAKQQAEEQRAFFVAFSRAISHVVFTFARRRDSGRGLQTQRRAGVASLYDALDTAGATRVTV